MAITIKQVLTMDIDKIQAQQRIIELVRQTQLGDQAAFASLYDEFANRIHAFIRIKVTGPELAEDILQDVFLKVWKGCKSLDLTDLNFSAWIYKITANTINDHYRKAYRQPQPVSIDEASQIANDDDPALNTHRGLEKVLVHDTVKLLPPNFREVIELRFFQDLSVADTAKILGKESITIRVWQHRAMKQLEKLFKQTNRNERTT